jgi:DnaJ domain
MPYLLFGLAALVLMLTAMRVFTMANPHVLVRQVRVGAGAIALAGAGILLARGAASYALSLAALGSWLLWGWGALQMPRGLGQAPPGSPDTSTSRVVTDHLDVVLDHASGAVDGRILKGRFKDRAIEDLRPVDLVQLWSECRFADPPSAQILEAYLDRRHPSWREDSARSQSAQQASSTGAMTVEEAYAVLGLAPGATIEDVRQAHRDLMLKVHPDRGGSTFLAARVNEAKDVLLATL